MDFDTLYRLLADRQLLTEEVAKLKVQVESAIKNLARLEGEISEREQRAAALEEKFLRVLGGKPIDKFHGKG